MISINEQKPHEKVLFNSPSPGVDTLGFLFPTNVEWNHIAQRHKQEGFVLSTGQRVTTSIRGFVSGNLDSLHGVNPKKIDHSIAIFYLIVILSTSGRLS